MQLYRHGPCDIHDRYFLDRVTTKTAELTPEGINLFHGSYSYYRMKKQQQEEEANSRKRHPRQKRR